MKTLLVSMCVMWMALATELACPSMLAHGSLLLPSVCGVIFWTRSTSGLMLAGLVLLLDWIARPTQLPLCPMFLPFVTVMFLAPSTHNEDYRARGFGFRLPAPLHLPLLTLAAVLLQTLGSVPLTEFLTLSPASPAIVDNLKSLAVIALPVSGGVSLMIRLADEVGLRRSFV